MHSASYIGRLAPSPTGLLHLGHARTFAAAAERARAAGGVLWLRDDDLDFDRVRPSFATAMRDDLRWLGLSWAHECRQSERLPLYRVALNTLLARGCVYPCTCTRRELLQAASAPHEAASAPHEDAETATTAAAHGHDDEPVYTGHCRPACPGAPLTFDPNANYRFHVPDGESVHFDDALAGPQSFRAGCTPAADFGDFIVWRRAASLSPHAPAAAREGIPSYQLASVADDIALGITEVVRGRDLLRSTARQLLLWRALGAAPPGFAHTELMRDERGTRLAKRHDALSLQTLRERGMTPAQVRAML